MAEYIEREEVIKMAKINKSVCQCLADIVDVKDIVNCVPTADVAPVRHGHWKYHFVTNNIYARYSIVAECSVCNCLYCGIKSDQRNGYEIFAGFFPEIPEDIAKSQVLRIAKDIKLSNYCDNCGAKMDGDTDVQT